MGLKSHNVVVIIISLIFCCVYYIKNINIKLCFATGVAMYVYMYMHHVHVCRRELVQTYVLATAHALYA